MVSQPSRTDNVGSSRSSSPEWTLNTSTSLSGPPASSSTADEPLTSFHPHSSSMRRAPLRKSTIEVMTPPLPSSSSRKQQHVAHDGESELDWSDQFSTLGLEVMKQSSSVKGKERAWTAQHASAGAFSSGSDEERDQLGSGAPAFLTSSRRKTGKTPSSVFSTSEETLVNSSPLPPLASQQSRSSSRTGTLSPVKRSSARLHTSRPRSPQSSNHPSSSSSAGIANRSASTQRSAKNRSSPLLQSQTHPDPPPLRSSPRLHSILPPGSTAQFVPRRRGRCNSISIPYPISVDHSLPTSSGRPPATRAISPDPTSHHLPHFSLDAEFPLLTSSPNSSSIDLNNLLGDIESLAPSLKRSLGEAMLREETKLKAKKDITRAKEAAAAAHGKDPSAADADDSGSGLLGDSTGDDEIPAPWKGGRKVSLGMGLFKETSGGVQDKESERKDRERVMEIDRARDGMGLGSAVVFEELEEEDETRQSREEGKEGAELARRKSSHSHHSASRRSNKPNSPISPKHHHHASSHTVPPNSSSKPSHHSSSRRPTLMQNLSADQILDSHGVSSFQLSPPSNHNRPSVLIDLQSSSVNLLPASGSTTSSILGSPSTLR